MALSRREWLLSLPMVAGTIASCSTSMRSAASKGNEYVELLRTPQANPQKVLVFLPDTSQTREVWVGLCDELASEFELIAVRTESASSAAIIAKAMATHRPVATVLMNNPTVAAYRAYQRSTRSAHYPPSIVVMTSFFGGQEKQLVNATGITYEVPLITAVTNLRKLIATPVNRIGVVHRAALSGFVAREAKLAHREQIEVVTEQVANGANVSELKRALRLLKQRADALWILNDDRLLQPGVILNGWLPGLHERPWLPSIVDAASLVSPASSFGTFAVLPDHGALGVQVAELLFEIADNGWVVAPNATAQLPLSVTTTLDLPQAQEHFRLQENALAQVDRILE